MAPRESQINTSLGSVHRAESRSFGREYITFGKPINSLKELAVSAIKFLPHTIGKRRFVMRGLMSEETIEQAKKRKLPIEAVIPMNLVTGNENEKSGIVYLAKNRHHSPRQGENQHERIKNRHNGRTPLQRAREMNAKGEFHPVKNLKLEDAEDLYLLWKRFGWNKEEILHFINKIQRGEENLWFSGMRDSKTGHLVAACNAEAIEFAGIRYIETTEYSTLHNYENRSLNTTAVSALIAQILANVHYPKKDNLITVITAEFNTSSNSASVGASAGFTIPEKEAGVSGILSYNVAVDDNQPANEVFSKSKKLDRGISYGMLRDFVLGIIPINNIDNMYPQDAVQEIISYYQ